MNIPELQTLLGSPLDEAPTSRRDALRKTGKLGAGLALAALPASALIPKVAFAQSAPTALEILNYALTLEYLEQYFYQLGTDALSGSIPSEDLAVFELVEQHEEDHVAFLTTVINNIGGDPVEFTADDFDYSILGLDPFNDYSDFLLLAMGFEDTGVRAYKGQAPYLLGTPYLTPALQIHALEARHAAEIRRIRRKATGAPVVPWIILDDSDAYPDPFAPIYGGADAPDGYPLPQFPPEENTTHAGVDLTTFPSPNGDPFTAVEASASFDEPLGMDAVTNVASLFFADESDESA